MPMAGIGDFRISGARPIDKIEIFQYANRGRTELACHIRANGGRKIICYEIKR